MQVLADTGLIGNNQIMTRVYSSVELLSSARMAASMTSRARRPMPSA
jgi:hypothetical protein